MSDLKRITATGDVVTRDAKLLGAVFEHTAAATCDIRVGGATGEQVATLRLGAAGTVTWSVADPDGVDASNGIHVTLSAGNVAVEFA